VLSFTTTLASRDFDELIGCLHPADLLVRPAADRIDRRRRDVGRLYNDFEPVRGDRALAPPLRSNCKALCMPTATRPCGVPSFIR